MFDNISSNKAFIAVYDINSYTVKWVDWNGSTLKTEKVNWGNAATPPSNPNRPGYTFTGWDISYSSIKVNTTITAQYTAIKTFIVTPTAGQFGSISPSTPQTVYSGSDITFTFTPNNGYVVSDVYVNSIPMGVTNNTFTIQNVTSNTTISVEFKSSYSEKIKIRVNYKTDWTTEPRTKCETQLSWQKRLSARYPQERGLALVFSLEHSATGERSEVYLEGGASTYKNFTVYYDKKALQLSSARHSPYDSYNRDIIFYGIKPGKTTMTFVHNKSGDSTEFEVTVLPYDKTKILIEDFDTKDIYRIGDTMPHVNIAKTTSYRRKINEYVLANDFEYDPADFVHSGMGDLNMKVIDGKPYVKAFVYEQRDYYCPLWLSNETTTQNGYLFTGTMETAPSGQEYEILYLSTFSKQGTTYVDFVANFTLEDGSSTLTLPSSETTIRLPFTIA